MKKIAALALSIAMVAMMAPATATTTTENFREENREFLMEKLGDEWDPDATIEVTANGQVHEMKASEALDLYLDQTERTNLKDVVNSDVHDDSPTAGDIALINFGSCITPSTYEATPVPFTPIDYQLWIYDGGAMEGTTPANTFFVAYTEKSIGIVDDAAFAGQGSYFCFSFFFFTIGIVTYDGVLA